MKEKEKMINLIKIYNLIDSEDKFIAKLFNADIQIGMQIGLKVDGSGSDNDVFDLYVVAMIWYCPNIKKINKDSSVYREIYSKLYEEKCPGVIPQFYLVYVKLRTTQENYYRAELDRRRKELFDEENKIYEES
jgi:hypothetical protein